MRKHNIDGLPGITMHGKKGPDGPRGGMTFCNSESSVTFDNIVMDNANTYSLGIVYDDKKYSIIPFISNGVAPIENDYVLNVTTSYTDLYNISQEIDVALEDIEGFIRVQASEDPGISAPGFVEVIIGDDEEEEEIEESVFIKFGDTSIGYYALLKEISEQIGLISGLHTSKGGAFFGTNTLKMYAFDKLDTWNFLNGVPDDIDLGVSVRTIEIQRNAWAGYYTPRSVIKRNTYKIGKSAFEHFCDGEAYTGDNATLHAYYVNVLGFHYKPSANKRHEVCALDSTGTYQSIMTTTYASSETLLNGESQNVVSYTLKFVNALTGKPIPNETFSLTFHCGKHHFCNYLDRYGNPSIFIVDGETNSAAEFEGVTTQTTVQSYASNSLLDPGLNFISRMTVKNVFTNLEGVVTVRMAIPNNFPTVNLAYIEATNKVESDPKDDLYIKATILVNDFTYGGTEYDEIVCKILPRDIAKDSSIVDEVVIGKDFDKYLDRTIAGSDAKFEANIDEFVYIDTATPTSKTALVPEEGEEEFIEPDVDGEGPSLFEPENVVKYLTDPEYCKGEAKSFAFTQFLVSSSLSEEDKRKIRIEAEITYDSDMFIPKVSTCLKDLWKPEMYDGDEYGGGYAMAQAIELRQEALLNDAMNNPEKYKTMYFNTRTDAGGMGNGIGTIYYGDGDQPANPRTAPLLKMFGHIKNLDHTLNFDKEDIFPCTLVIKDYNEGNNRSEYVSTLLVPNDLIGDAVIRIYAYYKKTSSASLKILLGETGFGATLEE